MPPENANKYYLTTPIYYVNARPHIGHAYTTIVADVLARRHRLLGEDVFFLTGTDEHGQKIERSAAAAGIPPQQFADEVSAQFRTLWDRMGLTYDRYIRTTDPAHKRGAQKLFQTLYDRGYIYLSTYTGAYCVSDEAFVDAPVGTACPDCGRILEEVTEENFFFKLSEFQKPLIDLIESSKLSVEPESRRNEVLSFLRGNVIELVADAIPLYNEDSLETFAGRAVDALNEGENNPIVAQLLQNGLIERWNGEWLRNGALKDLSVSRSSFSWGIPVPEEVQKAAKTTQKHIIYVWLDALSNYITAIGYGATEEQAQAEFAKYWPADLQLVGKEIIRFHCVYWPAFLLAAGLPLPKAITAHGWLLFDNSKMSKSKGNIVRTETILQAFGDEVYGKQFPESTPHERDLFASDVLRYFLLREIPFGQDGSFSFDALITRYNADLANGYGNLVSRVLPLILNNYSASVPAGAPHDSAKWDKVAWFKYAFSRSPSIIKWSQPEDPFNLPLVLNARLRGEFLQGIDVDATKEAYGYAISAFADFLDETNLAPNYYEITEHEIEGFRSYLLASGKEQAARSYISAIRKLKAFAERFSGGTMYEIIHRALFAALATELPLHSFLAECQLLISVTDGYISENKPWKLAKIQTPETEQHLSEVLYTAAESIRIITALLHPVLPYSTARVWTQLGLGDIEAAAKNGELNNLRWGGLKPGTKLGPLGPIFPRADKGLAQIMSDIENTERPASPLKQATTPAHAAPVPRDPTHPAAPPQALDEPSGTLPVAGSTAHTSGPDATPSHAQAPASGIFANQPPATEGPADASPQITIDDFAKVELRVAEIKVCERIPKADKLLRLEVDLGHEKRQILSGIAEHYAPEDLIGRRIIVITNLAPRKMRGLESHGMLLAASGPADGPDGGKPILATVGEGVPLGTRLK